MDRTLINGLIELQSDLGRCENTIAVMESSFRRLTNYLNLTKDGLSSFTKPQAQKMVTEMGKNGYSNSTIKITIVYLKMLYDFADMTAPFEKLRYPTDKKNSDKDTIKFFELEEVNRILDCAKNQKSKNSKRDFAIMSLLFNCGLRKSELLSLNRDSIDFETNELTLLNTKTEEKAVMEVGQKAVDAIQDYLSTRKDDNESLFISSYKTRISESGCDTIIKKIYKLAGVSGSVHKTRHSLCSIMADQGFSRDDIQHRARHSSGSTTDLYISQSKNRKRQVANALSF